MGESLKENTDNNIENANHSNGEATSTSKTTGFFGKLKNKFGARNKTQISLTEIGELRGQTSTDLSAASPEDQDQKSVSSILSDSSGVNEVSATDLINENKDSINQAAAKNDLSSTEADDEKDDDGGKESNSLNSVVDRLKNLTKMQKLLVGIIVFYVVLEVLFPDMDKPTPAPAMVNKKNRVKKDRPKKETTQEVAQQKVQQEEPQKEEPAADMRETNKVSEESNIEDSSPAETPVAEEPVTNIEEPTVETVSNDISNDNNEETDNSAPIEEAGMDKMPDQAPAVSNNLEQQAIDSETPENLNNVIEEQKELAVKEEEQNQEYQVMPNFEVWGRGLVYNCKGKHWACVDRENYFQCRRNQKWNSLRSKKPECVTSNVYASSEDCRTIQIYNINQAVSTDFCK